MLPTIEQKIAYFLMGTKKPSILMSDAYKFSMAICGFPLRKETFYLSFRNPFGKNVDHAGYYIPFDIREIIKHLIPKEIKKSEKEFLAKHGYEITNAMAESLKYPLEIDAVPKGMYVFAREPIVTITGPSFLVSWLEPMVIWLNYYIQAATYNLNGIPFGDVNNKNEKEIFKLLNMPPADNFEEYFIKNVQQDIDNMKDAIHGEMNRVVEVGMRGATNMAMHETVLKLCKKGGITKTSNCYLAKKLGMIPAGTTGHEHQQRWGNDVDAFRAIRDMKPGVPSYLFDTFDVYKSGMPAIRKVIGKRPAAIRFDRSDDCENQYNEFMKFEEKDGFRASYMFMDSINDNKVAKIEKMTEKLENRSNRVFYGVGGFFTTRNSVNAANRDVVSAVYKLCCSDGVPVMKISSLDEISTKVSMPGHPVVFRNTQLDDSGIVGIIGQKGEAPPEGYILLTNGEICGILLSGKKSVILSKETGEMVKECRKKVIHEVMKNRFSETAEWQRAAEEYYKQNPLD